MCDIALNANKNNNVELNQQKKLKYCYLYLNCASDIHSTTNVMSFFLLVLYLARHLFTS